MKLIGYTRGKSRLYYLDLVIDIPELKVSKPMTFLVDTGSNMTMICGPDAIDLDLSSLSQRPTVHAIMSNGVSTPVTPLFLCSLNYVKDDKYSKIIDFIGVEQPVPSEENEEDVKNSTNILGTDFLIGFKISLENDCVILEK